VQLVVKRVGEGFDAAASLRRAKALVGRDYDEAFQPGSDRLPPDRAEKRG